MENTSESHVERSVSAGNRTRILPRKAGIGMFYDYASFRTGGPFRGPEGWNIRTPNRVCISYANGTRVSAGGPAPEQHDDLSSSRRDAGAGKFPIIAHARQGITDRSPVPGWRVGERPGDAGRF